MAVADNVDRELNLRGIDLEIDALRNLDPDCNLLNEVYFSMGGSDVSRYYSTDQCNDTIRNFAPGLTILNYNVRSLKANGDSLLALLQSMSILPEIIVLTETG